MITILMFNMEEGEFQTFQKFCARIGHIPLSVSVWRGEGNPLHQLEEAILPAGFQGFLHGRTAQPQELDASAGHCRIRTAKKYYDISYEDILFIECECKKSVIHTKQGKVTVPVPLYRIKQELPTDIFVQTHRSFIVQLENMVSIDKTREPWEISFADSAERAVVSRSYRKEFLCTLEAFLRN